MLQTGSTRKSIANKNPQEADYAVRQCTGNKLRAKVEVHIGSVPYNLFSVRAVTRLSWRDGEQAEVFQWIAESKKTTRRYYNSENRDLMQSHLRAEEKLLAQETVSFESCQAAGIYVLESMVPRLCIYRQSPQCTKRQRIWSRSEAAVICTGQRAKGKGQSTTFDYSLYLVAFLSTLSDLFP